MNMNKNKKVGAAADTSQLQIPHYEDFEPLCYWRREDGQDTLVVHLPEFKKEQLKIQISSAGILKITGECPVDATKRSRFLKEIKVTKDYYANNIHAKFAQGQLNVTFPKKKISSSSSQKPSSAKEFPANDQTKKQGIGKSDHQVPDDHDKQNAANTTTGKVVNGTGSRIRNGKYEEASMDGIKEEKQPAGGRTNGQFVAPAGGGDQVVRSKRLGKVAVLVLSVGVAMGAALGSYVTYKYWSVNANADEDLLFYVRRLYN